MVQGPGLEEGQKADDTWVWKCGFAKKPEGEE